MQRKRLLTHMLYRGSNFCRNFSQAANSQPSEPEKQSISEKKSGQAPSSIPNDPKNTSFNNTKIKVPKYNPIEYEIFKFPTERDELLFGYTLQELYGTRYGLKHSPAIRKEIAKDNVMVVIALVGAITLALLSRNKQSREEEAWLEYYYHDMNYVNGKKKKEEVIASTVIQDKE